MSRKTLLILPLLVAGMATSASAYDPIVLENGWQQLSYDQDQGCEGEVRGNGKIFYVYAVGLGDGAAAHYHLGALLCPIQLHSARRRFAEKLGHGAREYLQRKLQPRHGVRLAGGISGDRDRRHAAHRQ